MRSRVPCALLCLWILGCSSPPRAFVPDEAAVDADVGDGSADSSTPSDSCADCSDSGDDVGMEEGPPPACTPGATRACSETATGEPIVFPTGTPLGRCKSGTQTCSMSGEWSACADAIGPQPRACGEPDDVDCDGKPDNTLDAVCGCDPVVTPARACFPYPTGKPGTGPCTAGVEECVLLAGGSTKWSGMCVGAVGPAPADTCVAGNDANCNGVQNEGCACVDGATIACGGPDGCGGGTQRCTGGAWGPCLGYINKSCPAGYARSGAKCTQTATVTKVLRDDAGGDGFSFGPTNVPFTVWTAKPGFRLLSNVRYRYETGGCYSSTTPDAIRFSCQTRPSQDLAQCATGAPGACAAGSSYVGLFGNYCNYTKIRGWTPPFQGTCIKRVDHVFSAEVDAACSW